MKCPSPKNFVRRLRLGGCIASLVLLSCLATGFQIAVPGAHPTPAQPEVFKEVPKDALGRTTPRGTVLGFLAVVQKGEYEVAAEYLDTQLHGKAAATLAQQLSVVLDRRLPAKLNQLSDDPEGSLVDPLNPDRDLVGTIPTSNGDVQILLERTDRKKSGPIWLFSGKTLESIPDIYDEIDVLSVDDTLPAFLVTTRVLGIQLFEWVALLLGLPLLYLFTLLLNRLLSSLAGHVRRRLNKNASLPNPEVLHAPTRILLIVITITWLRPRIGLSLLARQFWTTAATLMAVVAIVWILILLTGRAEEYINSRLRRRNFAGTASVLRLTRRVIDLLLIFAGVLGIVYHFGFSPTAALAGLGVGGIAVALAAQKTLENVVGGVSLIIDQAVRVGDTLKVADTLGQVDVIGLRSTRIRTLDRTVVCIPNGQIASMSLETLSARDKFWFHPLIGLRYETTAGQIRSVVDNIRILLTEHSSLERGSVRVRFLGFGSSSLDVDVFAYIYARDWNHFLEIQEGLLFFIMDIVQEAGAKIALPSRVMYLGDKSVADSDSLQEMLQPVEPSTAPRCGPIGASNAKDRSA
jgi:MscS family membrane protein